MPKLTDGDDPDRGQQQRQETGGFGLNERVHFHDAHVTVVGNQAEYQGVAQDGHGLEKWQENATEFAVYLGQIWTNHRHDLLYKG